jgi:hypothetical protein
VTLLLLILAGVVLNLGYVHYQTKWTEIWNRHRLRRIPGFLLSYYLSPPPPLSILANVLGEHVSCSPDVERVRVGLVTSRLGTGKLLIILTVYCTLCNCKYIKNHINSFCQHLVAYRDPSSSYCISDQYLLRAHSLFC